MDSYEIINLENIPEEAVLDFANRIATRAVVLNKNNLVGILYSTKMDFYQLPGGKVEVGETMEEGVIRECEEEIGCNVEVVAEIGKTKEYRKYNRKINDSTCFIAKALSIKEGYVPDGEDEIKFGMVVKWMAAEDIIKGLESSRHYEPAWVQTFHRDMYFLKQAQEYLKKNNI